MALKSTNIANTLLQTLAKLTAQGDNIVITRETAKPIQTLITVCTLLIDSADAIVESSGDPDVRERTSDFSSKMRVELRYLDQIRKAIEINPNDYALKGRLLQSAKNITTFTTQLVTGNEDALLQKVVDSAKNCASSAKILISSTEGSYEDFFEACKIFGASSLGFAKLLQEVARKVEDRSHQEKVIAAYNSIKEIGPQIIRAAKRAFENPRNMETQQELHMISRTLIGKISYAISVSQPDGGKSQNEISASQPTIPLPNVPQITEDRSTHRRKTIQHPAQGDEILSRVKTATAARVVEDTIEQASMLHIRKLEATMTPVPEPEPEITKNNNPNDDEDAESIIVSMEQQLQQSEPVNDNNLWKSKYEELAQSMEKVQEENSILLQENETLNKLLDSMRKRVSLRT